MAKDGYDPALWHNTKCTYLTDASVEWDWLTFLVNVSSASTSYSSDFTALFDIYRRACGGQKCTSDTKVRWDDLRDEAALKYGSGDGRYVRFNAALVTHGVNH
jgi:hypothetical protein